MFTQILEMLQSLALEQMSFGCKVALVCALSGAGQSTLLATVKSKKYGTADTRVGAGVRH